MPGEIDPHQIGVPLCEAPWRYASRAEKAKIESAKKALIDAETAEEQRLAHSELALLTGVDTSAIDKAEAEISARRKSLNAKFLERLRVGEFVVAGEHTRGGWCYVGQEDWKELNYINWGANRINFSRHPDGSCASGVFLENVYVWGRGANTVPTILAGPSVGERLKIAVEHTKRRLAREWPHDLSDREFGLRSKAGEIQDRRRLELDRAIRAAIPSSPDEPRRSLSDYCSESRRDEAPKYGNAAFPAMKGVVAEDKYMLRKANLREDVAKVLEELPIDQKNQFDAGSGGNRPIEKLTNMVVDRLTAGGWKITAKKRDTVKRYLRSMWPKPPKADFGGAQNPPSG